MVKKFMVVMSLMGAVVFCGDAEARWVKSKTGENCIQTCAGVKEKGKTFSCVEVGRPKHCAIRTYLTLASTGYECHCKDLSEKE